jgi:hypothetical protein
MRDDREILATRHIVDLSHNLEMPVPYLLEQH